MKKRVCLVDYDMSVRGGVEQVTASLANALADYCEVYVVSLMQTGEVTYSLDKRIHYTALGIPRVRLREQRRILRPVLRKFLLENEIDVAILQGHYAAFLCGSARFYTRTRLVFCDHGALMNQWRERDVTLMRRINSLLCHDVVVLTQQSREAYIKRFHIPRRKIRCIYNWIDEEAPHSTEYQVSSKRLLSAGRFEKEKGFDMLVKAYVHVARKHPDWRLDLYGDGKMLPQIQTLIEQEHLEENICLMGMRSDLAERYGQYAMYVLPSYREGMPLVLLEAKLNRLPIVAFDVMTGPREIVRHEVDGLLVPPEDTKALANAMCRLIEDEPLRRQMALRTQEDIARFSKDKILSQWLSLIQEQ